MKIRGKIIIVVLPLLGAALLISTMFSSNLAQSGMNRLAMGSLGFKSRELNKYMDNQWNLLFSNGFSEDPEYVEVAKNAVISYAMTILNSPTEIIFAIDEKAGVVMSTSETNMGIQERSHLKSQIRGNNLGWKEFQMAGSERVGDSFYFEPFDWYVFVSEDSKTFYREITELFRQNLIILGAALGASFILILILASYLSRPIRRVVDAMNEIIRTNDLSRKVKVEYADEVGVLANTFNIMTGELNKAYDQIKNYAFKAVLAQKNEHKIRNIFQKYVPKDVIDGIFENPESMLVGENRVMAILFSDIRSFTTISEGYMPDELVDVLNRYFEIMVDIIVKHNGVVDKYIGDAIMAFFGAPIKRPDDAHQAVLAALEMQEALIKFNNHQRSIGKPPFLTGIGINYGVVTVGNIGSEKKMDYTIIGDMVNLGSRLEGLTKPYKQTVIFSESVNMKLKGKLPTRLVDKVQVKGKTMGESVYTGKISLTEREKQGWAYHNAGIKVYYDRKFKKASQYFQAVQKSLPGDFLAEMYLERCSRYIKSPPSADWNGTEVMTSK